MICTPITLSQGCTGMPILKRLPIRGLGYAGESCQGSRIGTCPDTAEAGHASVYRSIHAPPEDEDCTCDVRAPDSESNGGRLRVANGVIKRGTARIRRHSNLQNIFMERLTQGSSIRNSTGVAMMTWFLFSNCFD